MADATSPDIDPSLAIGSVHGMTGGDELMTTNSAPSGKEAHLYSRRSVVMATATPIVTDHAL